MSNQNKDSVPQQPAVEAEASQKDDALFDALNQTKKKRKRQRIRTVALILAIVAVVLTVAVWTLRRQVRERFAISSTEVVSAQAQRGTISTVVSGSGLLENVDTEVVSVPSGVTVTEILVEFGDSVNQNDLLATVDMATVRTAMSELQADIEDLDSQITAAEGDTVSSYIPAGVPGRIKRLYAQKDVPVADTMVEHGALAVISLDGYMAVDIETDALAEGDTVSVLREDGSEEAGTVDTVIGGTATILITDDGPACDEAVTVQTDTGTVLGEGSLYIHNPLMVTGYAGTVSWIHVKENQSVTASTTLFTLTDTSTSASYDALLQTRSEAEEDLLELLQIQRYGGLIAPISGSVYSVADLDAQDDTTEITDIVTLAPDVSMSVTINVDEGDILSLALDQTADVTVSSVSDDTLQGVVTEIDKTASDGTYTAVVTLDKADGMLPGMTASVDIRIEGVDDAILIPTDALHQTSTGYYVYTSYDTETQEYGGRVDVVPGLSNSNYVEIKSGLNEGDVVYYSESTSIFGNMGRMEFGSMGGGQRPSGSAGFEGMPSGGEMPGGNMPSGDMRGSRE